MRPLLLPIKNVVVKNRQLQKNSQKQEDNYDQQGNSVSETKAKAEHSNNYSVANSD
jgi:hypothetical protein